MLAGFFTKNISAISAKLALLVGLTFYLVCTFIYPLNIHFVHIWGIEFLLNMTIMFGVSYFYPKENGINTIEKSEIEFKSWRFTPHLSIALCVVTILIYVSLGNWS